MNLTSKIHAVLCQNWNARVKGRDWFDLVWYVGQKVPLSISHLQTRLIKSEDWLLDKALTPLETKKLLEEKLAPLDIEQARQDVWPFIQDKDSLSLWSKDFFCQVIEKIVFQTSMP